MATTIHADARLSLLESLPKNAIGAEVGVWKGGFSQRILQIAKPQELNLIDPWRLSMEVQHANAWYGSKSAPDMEEIFNEVKKKFAVPIARGTVKIHRGLSTDLWRTFPEAYFDFVYIDGDHSYEAVRADLFASYSRVKQGGLICGDDYSLGGWWKDGVVKGMHEFLASHAVHIELVLGNQFVIRKIGA